MPSHSIFEIRRANLRRLADQVGGQARLVKISAKSGPYVSQVLNGVKTLGEAAARHFERSVGVPLGTLDAAQDRGTPDRDLWNSLPPAARSLVAPLLSYLTERDSTLTSDEISLVKHFRGCTEANKKLLLATALALASPEFATATNSVEESSGGAVRSRRKGAA